MSSDLSWSPDAARQAIPGVTCRRVTSAAERADHYAIRHRIFVEEQSIFPESDLDARDRDGSAIALIAACDGVVAGTVRLFVLDDAAGIWQGDRLAVLSAYRLRGVGGPLVNGAVATAAAVGGTAMTAHIQPKNVRFFQRLGWVNQGGREIYAGLVHQPMRIVLPAPDVARETLRQLSAGVNARAL